MSGYSISDVGSNQKTKKLNPVMKSNSINSIASVLAIVGTAAFASTANAATIYEESFETYSLGDSNGQGGWVDFGGTRLTNVVNTISSGGTQSLEFLTNPGYGSDTTLDLGSPITSGQLTLSYDIFQPTGYDGQAHVYLSRGATLTGNFDAGLDLVGNGTTGLFGAGGTDTPLLLDQWVSVVVNIDLDADTAVATYGGTEIFNGAWLNGGTSPQVFQGMNAWTTGGEALSSFNIDNMVLTSTIPEPSSLALLGLGLAGSVIRRRRA